MSIDINAKVLLIALEAIILALIAQIGNAHFDDVTEDRILWVLVASAAGVGVLVGKPIMQALQDAMTSPTKEPQGPAVEDLDPPAVGIIPDRPDFR